MFCDLIRATRRSKQLSAWPNRLPEEFLVGITPGLKQQKPLLTAAFCRKSAQLGRPSVTIMSHAGFFKDKRPETPKKAAIAAGFTLLRCALTCLNWAIDSARGDRSPTGFRQIRGGFTQSGVDRTKRGR
jgi:hypothetical protein